MVWAPALVFICPDVVLVNTKPWGVQVCLVQCRVYTVQMAVKNRYTPKVEVPVWIACKAHYVPIDVFI